MKSAMQELIELIKKHPKFMLDHHIGKIYNKATELLEKEKQLQVDLLEWYDKLSPADKCTVWPPAGSGSGHGLYNMSKEDLVDRFLNKTKL